MFGPSKEHIEIVGGAGGPKPRIKDHRIRVLDVMIWHERQAMSVDEIVDHFPQLSMAEVHAALAYYWDYQEEMERKEAKDNAWVDEYKRTHPSESQERLERLRGG